MPALNFKKEFAPLVENGLKRCTIRARRRDCRNPQPGQKLYLYTGMRTKSCRKLGEARCKNSEPILIELCGDVVVVIVRFHPLSPEETEALAKRDGFSGYDDFIEFFSREHGLPFHGFLIEW